MRALNFRAWDHQLVQEAYPFTARPAGKAKDKYDLMELGAAVPGADQDLEVIYPTREQNPCKL